MNARLEEFVGAMAHVRDIVQQHVRDVSTHMETVVAHDFVHLGMLFLPLVCRCVDKIRNRTIISSTYAQSDAL